MLVLKIRGAEAVAIAATAPELNKLPPSAVRNDPALNEPTDPLAKVLTKALKAAESPV
jgi:hypothetical protein